MKRPAIYIIILSLAIGCAKKTYDVEFYREQAEIAKQKEEQERLAQERLRQLEIDRQTNPYKLTDEQKTKLSELLEIERDSVKETKLYHYIIDWVGTPYLWGGNDENGIDCSAFVQKVYENVYEKELPRTSQEMFLINNIERFKNRKYLNEGDLVFFRMKKERIITHVGIYLGKGKWVAANSSKGVEITDLNDYYWGLNYVASGRIIELNQ